jgi:hypothetical protein
MADGARQSSLRASTAILATLLPIAAIGVLLCWSYRSARVADQVAREYRHLQSLGEQIASAIDAQISAAEAQDSAVKQSRSTTRSNVSDFRYCLSRQGTAMQVSPRCKSDLAELLRPALVETLGIDELVVTTSQRTILASWGKAHLTISQLGELASSEACSSGWLKSAPPPAADPKDPKNAAKPAGTPLDRSERKTVCWLDRSYLLFSVPVSLQGNGVVSVPVTDAKWELPEDGGEHEQLWLHALVSDERFRGDTWRIPYAFVVGGSFLLVLLLLSWPMLRLWTIGARERLRAVDLSILVLCLVTAAGISTIGLLAGGAEWRSRRREDADLLRVATQVKERFRREVQQSVAQLVDFQGVGPMTPRSSIPLRTNHLMGVSRAARDGAPLLRLSPVPDPKNQGWRMAVYLGEQPDVRVRRYFQDAQRQNLWRIRKEYPDRSEPGGARVSVEVVRSRLTSRLTLVVARPLNWRPGRSPEVIFASTDLRPFNPPYVPLGYGFAIVGDDGVVQLHSEGQRSLLENFFEESERDPLIAGLVRAGTGEPFDMRYLGEDQRGIAIPLMNAGERIPWTVVAFRKRDVLRAVNSESLLAAIVIFAAYVVCLALLLMGGQLLARRGRLEWLWPDRHAGRVKAYALATVVVLAAASGAFVAVDRLGASAGLWGLLTVPVVVLGALSWLLRPHGWSSNAPRAPEPVFRGLHACFLTALAVLLGVLPAAAVYCDGRAQAEHDLRTYQMAVQADHQEDRRQTIDRNRPRDPTWVIQERISDTCDVYGGIEGGSLAASSVPRLTRLVRDLLPLGGRTAEMARALAWDTGAAPSAVAASHVAGVGLLVALGLLAFLSAANRSVFVLDADVDAGSADHALAPGALRWAYERGRAASSDPPTIVDLRKPPCASPEWVRRKDAERPHGSIEIRHGEAWLGDPTTRDVLRELLERLVADDVHVRLESDADVRKALADAGGDAAWTALLQGFASTRIFLPIDGALADADAAGDGGEPVYRGIWQGLGSDEQRVLWQLAREGFVNPGAVSVVRSLLGKGLVRRDGPLHVATPGLRAFVLRTVTPETIAKWESDDDGGWSHIRRPLSAAVGLGALFLFYSQPDFFNTTVATLTSVTVAVPTLLRFFTMLGDDKPAAKPT